MTSGASGLPGHPPPLSPPLATAPPPATSGASSFNGRIPPKAPSNPTNKNNKKNKPTKENASQDAAQINYLTTELNFAHTKIVSQDNTIKDLGFKVKILEDALKISEDKLNNDLRNKYFPRTDSCHVPPAPTCQNISRFHPNTMCPTFSLPSSCCCIGSHCPAAPPPPATGPHSGTTTTAKPTVPVNDSPAPNVQPSPNIQLPAWHDEITKVSSEIDSLRVDILQINSKVNFLSKTQKAEDHRSAPPTNPTSADINVEVDVNEADPGTDSDNSVNVEADEFVDEILILSENENILEQENVQVHLN